MGRVSLDRTPGHRIEPFKGMIVCTRIVRVIGCRLSVPMQEGGQPRHLARAVECVSTRVSCLAGTIGRSAERRVGRHIGPSGTTGRGYRTLRPFLPTIPLVLPVVVSNTPGTVGSPDIFHLPVPERGGIIFSDVSQRWLPRCIERPRAFYSIPSIRLATFPVDTTSEPSPSPPKPPWRPPVGPAEKDPQRV